MTSDTHRTEDPLYTPGDRVIYRQRGETDFTELPATYVRSQVTAGRPMHVIILDTKPNHPRQVGARSIRLA